MSNTVLLCLIFACLYGYCKYIGIVSFESADLSSAPKGKKSETAQDTQLLNNKVRY
jgi:hypothetical protein